MMNITKKNVLKILWESKVVEIGILIPATLPKLIDEVVDLVQVLPSTIPIVILEDMLIEVDLGHKIPATITIAIMEQELTLKVEVDIGIKPATITPITKVKVVDCLLYQEIMLVVMGELDISPRPSTIPPKN